MSSKGLQCSKDIRTYANKLFLRKVNSMEVQKKKTNFKEILLNK